MHTRKEVGTLVTPWKSSVVREEDLTFVFNLPLRVNDRVT
jgi:hypothetical protein